MRKLLLIAATTAAISGTSVFAAPNAENMFYLKAGAGADWMRKIKIDDKLHAKSKVAPIFMLGAGYYFMDNLRGDLTLEIVANPKNKINKKTATESWNHKISSKVGALMLNGYVDMFDVSIAGIFAGAGVGISRVKTKINGEYTDLESGEKQPEKGSTKNKHNLAYHATVGAAAELGEGVQGELAYSWRDYGKTGKWKNTTQKNKLRLRGHNVTASVVFGL